MTELGTRLAEHLRDTASSWSMGSYGAVAEFFQKPGEAIAGTDDFTCVTPRGGIRLEIRDDIRVCDFEKPDGRGDEQHQIALCLPVRESKLSNAATLTERGADSAALREDDCESVLFNLGVSALGSGCFQVDFCVRTDDPKLIDFCRRHCGSSVFAHGSPVVPRLLEDQPTRVVVTRLGRIEVYQVIGGDHTDGMTPDGPHTHLLPELLRLNLTHPPDVTIEDGWVPCAFLYASAPLFEA